MVQALAAPAPVAIAAPVFAAASPARPAGPPLSRVAAANREAVREPSREAWLNAVQVYDWTQGAIYRLYTAPERVSEIALEPGETLVSVAAGDTVRWVIGDTASGTGATRRTHVLVKPTAPGLSTNLVIATDRRVYHVLLESNSGAAMASMSWSYPQGALKVLDRSGEAGPLPAERVAGISLERLSFGYAIEGDDPPWRPLRAFDDGTQVFIEFPEALAQGEAPPLFVSGEGGVTELVNYRLRGRYYVVDRLFATAELRLGEGRQQVVRILRTSAGASGRRSRKGGR
ncbi:conjugal transfer protein TrbG [Altererythrobacter sp. Root672]|nr:conjugal transfer protein TrbG [Altererythrobacter sp. Root672]